MIKVAIEKNDWYDYRESAWGGALNILNEIELQDKENEAVEIIEEYMIDSNTGNEINNHKLDMENDKKLVDAYKEEKELLTSNEIKEIRNMYGMTQKEYAFALGMGEISSHRLEKTFIQSDETDSLMRLSGDPSIMLKLLKINK